MYECTTVNPKTLPRRPRPLHCVVGFVVVLGCRFMAVYFAVVVARDELSSVGRYLVPGVLAAGAHALRLDGISGQTVGHGYLELLLPLAVHVSVYA